MVVLERESFPKTKGFDNLDIERYRNPLNFAQIREDFSSLLLEMDVMKELVGGATLRQMFFVPGEGFYHNVNGELVKYLDFFDKAISDIEDVNTIERFKAEKFGWLRTEQLLQNTLIETVVVASPPGETYRFAKMKPLSATFVLNRGLEGTIPIDGEEKIGFMFDAYSLYVDEISSRDHMDILNAVGELTERVTDPNDSLVVVTVPCILKRRELDKLVQALGFESWQQIEERALNLQNVAKEGTEDKELRRQLIVELLKEGVEGALNKSSELDPKLMAEAIKRVLAKEAMGQYVDKTSEIIRQDILLTVLSLHKDSGISTKIHELVNPFIYSQWQVEQDQLIHNVVFQRMMSAHGGGGLMFEDKNSILTSIDGRMSFLSRKEKKKSECSKCHKSLDSEGKCEHCKK